MVNKSMLKASLEGEWWWGQAKVPQFGVSSPNDLNFLASTMTLEKRATEPNNALPWSASSDIIARSSQHKEETNCCNCPPCNMGWHRVH